MLEAVGAERVVLDPAVDGAAGDLQFGLQFIDCYPFARGRIIVFACLFFFFCQILLFVHLD